MSVAGAVIAVINVALYVLVRRFNRVSGGKGSDTSQSGA